MNNFDKQRIENAIWTIGQYEYEVKQIAIEIGFDSWDWEKVVDVLSEVKEHLTNK